jgi:cardiolipin synthase
LKKYLNIPNVLSASRLVLFPVMLYYIYHHERTIFCWLLFVSLITDIADGYIARRFNMMTPFGSRLDSWGDLCNYLAAIYGIITLCYDDVAAHATWFILLFSLYFAEPVISFFRFGRLIGLHLYSAKITGYIHGIFILTWLFFGFNDILFYISMFAGYFAFTEETIIILMLRKADTDLKGLYWVLYDRRDLL